MSLAESIRDEDSSCCDAHRRAAPRSARRDRHRKLLAEVAREAFDQAARIVLRPAAADGDLAKRRGRPRSRSLRERARTRAESDPMVVGDELFRGELTEIRRGVKAVNSKSRQRQAKTPNCRRETVTVDSLNHEHPQKMQQAQASIKMQESGPQCGSRPRTAVDGENPMSGTERGPGRAHQKRRWTEESRPCRTSSIAAREASGKSTRRAEKTGSSGGRYYEGFRLGFSLRLRPAT